MISGSDWRPSDAVTRRRTLFEISPLMHCSIIGTCLTTSELRKIVNSIVGDRDAPKVSDHQIHREGVHYASVPGLPTKLLNKALERRHATVIRKFNEHETECELREAWEQAKREGAIEGAYWAILTHPAATEKLANAVFGDVHMLSHLVGATSRADIKRLAKLEAETAALTAEIATLKAEKQAGFSARDKEVLRLQRALAAAIATQDQNPSNDAADLPDEVFAYRKLIADLQRRLSNESSRSERMREERDRFKRESLEAQTEIASAREIAASVAEDLQRLEGYLARLQTDSPEPVSLTGRTVLYVGGKAKSIQHLASLVAKGGGVFLHHDGGQEESFTLLPGLIAKSDFVFFPVDFVSHAAVGLIKKYCEQLSKPFVALPRAGVAALLRGLHHAGP